MVGGLAKLGFRDSGFRVLGFGFMIWGSEVQKKGDTMIGRKNGADMDTGDSRSLGLGFSVLGCGGFRASGFVRNPKARTRLPANNVGHIG